MPNPLLDELRGRGMGVVLGMLFGGATAYFIGWLKRHRERRSVLCGDARDTVVIHQHIIESVEDEGGGRPTTLRIRCIGQAEVNRVVPNGHLAALLLARASSTNSLDTLISMEGGEGSFLLETLTNFVGDRVANGPFEHDRYVMTACCEPADLSEHQPITILLIAESDLALFEDWPKARGIQVEHGSDGARILTLREMAHRFRQEQAKLTELRAKGERTRYVESMYILDLALDNRLAPFPTKPVPWGRFEAILKQMNLE